MASNEQTVTVTFPAPRTIDNNYYGRGTYAVPATIAKFAVNNGLATFPQSAAGKTAAGRRKQAAAEPQSPATEPEAPKPAPTATGLTDDTVAKIEALRGELPADFPYRDLLFENQITTFEAVLAARGDLRNIQGIDTPQISAMQTYLVQYVSQ